MARLVFFGNERIATGVTTTAPVLRALVEAGHEILAVVSHHSAGTSRKQRHLEIAEVADAHGIPVLLPGKPVDIIEMLQAMRADAAVLVAYGKIVPQSVIDVFPAGIINLHPSRLPEHRGPTPLESVLLDGSTNTAVSIMRLAKAMDAGPVYDQVEYTIPASISKQQLADELLALGAARLVELLPAIISGENQPTFQDDAQASYDKLITKRDGRLDFNKTAAQLVREVQAYLGWPGSSTQLGGHDIVITAVHAISGNGAAGALWREPKQFGFYTADGVFVIDTLRPAGKNTMPAAAFLAGYTV